MPLILPTALDPDWEDSQAGVEASLVAMQTTYNSHVSSMFGDMPVLQQAYVLGGSTHVAVQVATANTFTDAPNSYDVMLPDALPPGYIIAVVRVTAFGNTVGVTPRVIRTDTGASVGTGQKFTATTLVKWPTFRVVRFLVTPVTVTPFVPVYYRLQLGCDTASSDVFGIGQMYTGQQVSS